MANGAELSRRGVIAGSAMLVGYSQAGGALAEGSTGLSLVSQPLRVFKAADAGHERTDSWYLYLIAQTPDEVTLTPTRMRVEMSSAGKLAKSIDYVGEGLKSSTFPTAGTGIVPKLPDGSAPPSPLFWPFLIRLRQSEPTATMIDSMRVAITATDPENRERSAIATLSIGVYRQKTSLIFPLRGKGVILQAGVANGGHRNRSGQFALDVFGLTDSYSLMTRPGPGTAPGEYAGWGRDLMAPASGSVVRARGDRPDQPAANKSDPKYFASEFPRGGDVGNHVVIDHGNNEYSMIAHLKAGSLRVKVGDIVRQGDVVGKLGASGDATGPHVHYQLQAGPDWQYADGLPCTFTNVAEQDLFRGTYFEAI